MADIFGDPGDWKTNYIRFKTFHDLAYTKIDQGISLENSAQIDGAIQKYEEGFSLIEKALAIPIDCPSNPDPTWERACKMSDQMKRSRKDILSRLADIRAARHIPVEQRDDPDAPPSYAEAIASSSSESSGSLAPTPNVPQSSNSATVQSYIPGNVSNSGPTNTSAIQEPNTSSIAKSSTSPSSKSSSLYPAVPENTWHTIPAYSASTSTVDVSASSNMTNMDQTKDSQSKSRQISLAELGKALECVRSEISHQSALEIFTCNNVAVCHVTQAGEVTTSSQSEVLKIFLTEDIDNPRYYLQVGAWRYPLIKGVSPCIRTRYGAFLFPDLEAKVEGQSLGLIVPDDCVEPLAAILEDILNVEIQYGAHPGTRPPSDLPETISQHILSGGNYISNALIKGAEKVEQALSYGTPRVIEKMAPNKEPTELPSRMKSGIKVTKNVSESAAKTTGYIANKVSSATVGLGRFLSPHVKKGGTALLTRYYGCQEAEASHTMDSMLKVGAGAVEGIGAVYTGLEVAGAVLGRSLSDSTVKIVRHKYGQPAGEFTQDTFHTVGNVMEVNTNVRSLATKRLVKNTIKQTGKQVVLQHAKSSKDSVKSEAKQDPKEKPEKDPK